MGKQSKARVRSVQSGKLKKQARPFVTPLFAGIDLESDSLSLLKSQSLSLIEYVFRIAPLLRTTVVGNPFPRQIKQLEFSRYIPKIDDLNVELKWNFALFCRFSHVISHWLACKKQFEIAFLSGDESSAFTALDTFHRKHGWSLWEVESRFLAVTAFKGLEENRKLLKQLMKQSPNVLKIFVSYLGNRAEDAFSVDEYHSGLDPMLAHEPDEKHGVIALVNAVRFRLNPTSRNESTAFSSILQVEESYSLIDRYITWIRIAEQLFSTSIQNPAPQIATYVSRLDNELQGSRTSFLTRLAGDATQSEHHRLESDVFDLLSDYTEGSYERAVSVGTKLIRDYPMCLEPYEIVVKSAVHRGEKPPSPFSSTSTGTSLINHLYNIISRNAGKSESLKEIRKMAYRLDSFDLGPQLLELYKAHSSDLSPLQANPRMGISSTVATPRTFVGLCDGCTATPHLERLAQSYPKNIAVSLYLTTQTSLNEGRLIDPPVEVPDYRTERHQAHVLEALGKPREALLLYERLRSSHKLTPADLSNVTSGLYRCYTLLNDIEQAARLMVTICLQSPQIASVKTLQDLLSQYPEGGDATISRDIAWPVLFSFAQELGCRPTSYGELHDTLEDFLSVHGYRRPSELLKSETEFANDELVHLIRFICTPEVLSESIWFTNQEELFQERLLLCSWLSNNDPENRSEYQAEMAKHSRVAAIRDLTHRAERSRIYVDTDGIAKSLTRSIADRAHRSLALVKLSDKRLREVLEVANLIPEVVQKQRKLLVVDEGFALFESVFQDVKALFLSSSQYGLDANLSQRIRHGTLAGALRAPLEDAELVTLKGGDGEYHRNDHWIVRLSGGNENLAQKVHTSFSELAADVDSLIAEVRNEWVQIRTTSDMEKALFDFEFDRESLLVLYNDCMAFDDPDQLIDLVFASLWQRTERALQDVRTAINESLKERLFAMLDKCLLTIETICGSDQAQQIKPAFTSCRTQLTLAFTGIAEWFRLDEQQKAPSCRIRTVVDAVLEVVERFSGAGNCKSTLNFDTDFQLPGSAFRPVWDILFILLDNAVKHSGLAETALTVGGSCVEGECNIVVENSISSALDIESLQTRVVEINALSSDEPSLEYSKTEGGSGYSKLHKIIRYEMGIEKYEVAVTLPESGYSVSIKMDVAWANE